jgi:hypothetical protein
MMSFIHRNEAAKALIERNLIEKKVGNSTTESGVKQVIKLAPLKFEQ